jgi:hypothetical protein
MLTYSITSVEDSGTISPLKANYDVPPHPHELLHIYDEVAPDLVIFAVNHTESAILTGPRYVSSKEEFPLFVVDLHKCTAKCKRCEKTFQFLPILETTQDGESLSPEIYLTLKEIHNTEHLNCKRPVCLN